MVSHIPRGDRRALRARSVDILLAKSKSYLKSYHVSNSRSSIPFPVSRNNTPRKKTKVNIFSLFCSISRIYVRFLFPCFYESFEFNFTSAVSLYLPYVNRLFSFYPSIRNAVITPSVSSYFCTLAIKRKATAI